MALANTIQAFTTRVAQEFNSVRVELVNQANSINAVVDTKASQAYVDSNLALKADITYVDAGLAVKADSTYVDSGLALKSDTVYVDSALALKADITYVDSGLALKADQATTYTKTEVDSAVAVKANSADVYTKSEVYTKGETDTAISAGIASVIDTAPAALDTLNELAAALGNDSNFATTVATQIGLKADQATTYTKTEVDGLLSPITTELSDLGALDLVALFESNLD